VKNFRRYVLLHCALLGCLASTGRAEEEYFLYKLNRDPFDFSAIRPPEKRIEQESASDEQAMTFELRATLVSKQHSMANLNGKILLVGEELEGYRLWKIGEDEVVLEKDGKQFTVPLKQ